MNQVHKLVRGADVLQWIQRGDFRALVNELVDLYAWGREFRRRQLDHHPLDFLHPTVVDISNRTGQDLARFSVVQLGGPTIDPAVNLTEYQRSPAISGIIPTSPPDLSRFAILLDPIPKGASAGPYLIGRAALGGVVACQVNVSDTTHGFAIPTGGNTGFLVSTSQQTGAIILTQPTKTGVQWLQVRLGSCCAGNFSPSAAGSSQPSSTACCATSTVCFKVAGAPDLNGLPGSGQILQNGITLNQSSLGGNPTDNQGAWQGFLSGTGVEYEFIATCLGGLWQVAIQPVFGGTTNVMYYVSDSKGCATHTLSLSSIGTPAGWPSTATLAMGICTTSGGCCGSTAATVNATFSNALGFLGTVSLLRTGTDAWGIGPFSLGGCTGIYVNLECAQGVYYIQIILGGGQGSNWTALTTANCSPLHITGTGITTAAACTGGGSWSVDITG